MSWLSVVLAFEKACRESKRQVVNISINSEQDLKTYCYLTHINYLPARHPMTPDLDAIPTCKKSAP